MTKSNFKSSGRRMVATFVLALILGASFPVLAATNLSATISASPSSGVAPLNNVSLTATVSGDATGLVTYRFDCTSDGNWDWVQSNNNSTYTASNICNYPTAGNYTATVKVERENLSFQGTMAILVTGQVQTSPTVDLKINSSDGTINLDYGTAGNLSWTSANTTSCWASSDWSGTKSTSGSEGTGSVYSNKSYVITCTGPGGTASDNVGVLVNQQAQNLYVTLEAIPNNGMAPLNGVDLRATVSGNALGTINYRFDCTSDGTWDYNFYSITDNPKTVVDACNYPNVGTYWAKVRVERGTATPAEATAQVTVSSAPIVGAADVSIAKLARNASDNIAFAGVTSAKPGDVVEFQIAVTSTGPVAADNIVVKDTLPDKMTFYGALKVDGVVVSGDIQAGYNIGNLAPGQTRNIVFQAVIAGASSFGFGTTDLINTALSYNTNLARTATVKVQVTKTQVLGATTVSTGLFDNFKLSFLLSLAATMFFSYFLLLRFYLSNRAYVWGVNRLVLKAKGRIKDILPKESDQRAQERLLQTIREIKARENL